MTLSRGLVSQFSLEQFTTTEDENARTQIWMRSKFVPGRNIDRHVRIGDGPALRPTRWQLEQRGGRENYEHHDGSIRSQTAKG